MFPIFTGRKRTPRNKRTQQRLVQSEEQQLCPFGCLCCIMEQFYNQKCWCRETKESVGTQTDESSLQHKTEVSTGCQTDLPVDLSPDRHGYNSKNRIAKCGFIFNDKSADVKEGSMETSGRSKEDPSPENTVTEEAGPEVPLFDPRSDKHIHIQNKKRTVARKPVRRGPYQPRRCFDFRLVKPGTSVDVVKTERQVSEENSHVIKVRVKGDEETANAADETYRKYFNHGMMEYSQMQNTMGQLVEQYDLTGARDVNFELALCDIFRRFPELNDAPKTRKIVRDKLRHKISSRRHYFKMKSEATLNGIGVSVLKRHRRHENDIITSLIGDTVLHNSLQNGIATIVNAEGNSQIRAGSKFTEEHITSGSAIDSFIPPCAEDLTVHRKQASREESPSSVESVYVHQIIKQEPPE